MSSDAFRRTFVERMGGALTTAGLARLPSRIFAALLTDPDGRMTAAEIASCPAGLPGLGLGAVRYLDGVG